MARTSRPLIRVVPYESPGYRRRRRGSGFRYIDAGNRAVSRPERERINALAIPPAWQKVWIADTPDAHILAVGVDDAGRRQYIYHPRWRNTRDSKKFAHTLELAATLPNARRRVTRDLRRAGMPRERVLAAAFRVLDTTAIRVGGEVYATTNGSRGLSTLLCRHVSIDGDTISLSFPAKSGVDASASVHDADLAAVLRELITRPARSKLLVWHDGRRAIPLASADINEYIRLCTGGDFTAKDFRTLAGTLAAASALADLGPAESKTATARNEREAVAAAAAVLGNTPTVARSSYIDPAIWWRYEAGETIDPSITPETGLTHLLDNSPA